MIKNKLILFKKIKLYTHIRYIYTHICYIYPTCVPYIRTHVLHVLHVLHIHLHTLRVPTRYVMLLAQMCYMYIRTHYMYTQMLRIHSHCIYTSHTYVIYTYTHKCYINAHMFCMYTHTRATCWEGSERLLRHSTSPAQGQS